MDEKPKIHVQFHPGFLLLVGIPLAIACFYLIQLIEMLKGTFPYWLASNWGWLVFAGVILATPLWWKAYKAFTAHRHDTKDRDAYRALLTVATIQAQRGYNLEFTRGDVAFKLASPVRVHQTQVEEIESKQPQALLPSGELPTNVRYEDIRHQVPRDHILVGVGTRGIETKEKAVGACVWIVGLSGTGKTSTTVLRVEERAASGHQFLGIDPHFFKPDSLTNAITAYANKFIVPMARTPKETNKVLNMFLDEFKGRKSGKIPQPWKPITLLIDEVGSLMDVTEPLEKENADLIKSIARICGQEARNFNMGGILISQQATGLAWLRKVALMVIVHQLLMESEKRLATNNDTEVMLDMKLWPIGRTYVFGVGFNRTGPLTVQQPFFERKASSSDVWVFTDEDEDEDENIIDADMDEDEDTEELLDADYQRAMEAWNKGHKSVRALRDYLGITQYKAYELYKLVSV
jgi:hypothetical protein